MQKTTTEAGDGKQRAEGLLVRHEAGAEIVEDTPTDAGKRITRPTSGSAENVTPT